MTLANIISPLMAIAAILISLFNIGLNVWHRWEMHKIDKEIERLDNKRKRNQEATEKDP